jgi:hypothetical protein
MHDPKPPPPKTDRRTRSRVTNRSKLFLTGPQYSAEARRFGDILRAIVNDLGGDGAPLSEGQLQLARRAASLSVSCELLEQTILTGSSSAAEMQLRAATGGLSSYEILREAGRALHGVGRSLGGDTITAMAKLPDAQLDRVVDLLSRAGDLAAKCINAGSARTADLQLLGELSDRLGRTFGRLGLARVPRELNGGRIGVMPYARADQSSVWSPLRDAIARDAQPVDQDALEPLDVNSEASP